MAKSSIEWTDETWNPVVGCTRASAGCDNCYAVNQTKRLEAMGQAKYAGLVNHGKNHFNGVVLTVEDALTIPLRWKKPRKVFVNSMSDLFHKDVPFEFIDKVFAVMALTPQHTYQVLTKRPERMAEYLADQERRHWIAKAVIELPSRVGRTDYYDAQANIGHYEGDLLPSNFSWNGKWPIPNVWLGTSVEDQAAADERIPHLLKCPAAVRFLSCEPLIGPVDLTQIECGTCARWKRLDALNGRTKEEGWRLATPNLNYPTPPSDVPGSSKGASIHWVICGGESGPKARPMHPDWARSLRDQCQAAGVPFFFKQWGEWCPGDFNRFAPDYWDFQNGTAFHARAHGEPEDQYYQGPPTGLTKRRKVIRPFPNVAAIRLGKVWSGRRLDGKEWSQWPEASK